MRAVGDAIAVVEKVGVLDREVHEFGCLEQVPHALFPGLQGNAHFFEDDVGTDAKSSHIDCRSSAMVMEGPIGKSDPFIELVCDLSEAAEREP